MKDRVDRFRICTQSVKTNKTPLTGIYNFTTCWRFYQLHNFGLRNNGVENIWLLTRFEPHKPVSTDLIIFYRDNLSFNSSYCTKSNPSLKYYAITSIYNVENTMENLNRKAGKELVFLYDTQTYAHT